MRAKLVLLAFLASCEGRCRQEDAVADAVPGAICTASRSLGICIKGDDVLVCNVKGELSFTAACTTFGTLVRREQ